MATTSSCRKTVHMLEMSRRHMILKKKPWRPQTKWDSKCRKYHKRIFKTETHLNKLLTIKVLFRELRMELRRKPRETMIICHQSWRLRILITLQRRHPSLTMRLEMAEVRRISTIKTNPQLNNHRSPNIYRQKMRKPWILWNWRHLGCKSWRIWRNTPSLRRS